MDVLKISANEFGVIVHCRPAVYVPVTREADGTFTIGLPVGNTSGKAVKCTTEQCSALQGKIWGRLSAALDLGASEVTEIGKSGGKLRATVVE